MLLSSSIYVIIVLVAIATVFFIGFLILAYRHAKETLDTIEQNQRTAKEMSGVMEEVKNIIRGEKDNDTN